MLAFYLESLGCAKNEVDSEIMIASLERIGLRRLKEPSDADLIIVNTCGFIAPAKQQSIEYCLATRARYPDKPLIMAGCLSQRYREELVRQLPEVDGFQFDLEPEAIVRVVAGVLESRGLALPSAPAPSLASFTHRTDLLSYPRSAYVKIADGCDNRCSYCAIPLIKGNLRSRQQGQIIEEMRALRDRGIFEFNLVAQDLASFGLDRGKAELPELLRRIGGMEGD